MARNNDDMLMEDELAAAFFSDDDAATLAEPEEAQDEVAPEAEPEAEPEESPSDEEGEDDGWDNTDDFPGQLAVDVYETADRLVVKARTAGIKKSDLDVSISDNILTISGVLTGGEEDHTTRWHIQECYWGEFSRTIALPVKIREDGVKADLKDGVLTISFEKEKAETSKRITIN